MNGVFVTVEGPEGAGKTTLIKQLIETVSPALSVDILATREPGGNLIAEQIRAIILDPKHTQMDALTEALLYAAARRQHLVDNILPALHSGQLVLCDRFVDSSIAYQGYARQLGAERIQQINAFATENFQPDLTFYLDIMPEQGLARIHKGRDNEINRLDLEAMSFHEAVRKGYLQLVAENPQRIVVLDATDTVESLVGQCIEVLAERFSNLFHKEEALQ